MHAPLLSLKNLLVKVTNDSLYLMDLDSRTISFERKGNSLHSKIRIVKYAFKICL